jgi:hypothetical protein
MDGSDLNSVFIQSLKKEKFSFNLGRDSFLYAILDLFSIESLVTYLYNRSLKPTKHLEA